MHTESGEKKTEKTVLDTIKTSDQARREFWKQQMDEGFDFMESILKYPVEECFEELTSLRNAVDEAKIEVVFSGTQIVPGLDRQFYLRAGLIPCFLAAAREMNDRGMILKVEDGYRSRAMQKELALKQTIFDTVVSRVVWEHNGQAPPFSSIRKRLGVLIAWCPKVGTHMSGSAIDISVLNHDTGEEVDRGAPYLELSELTPMSSPFIDQRCRSNRDMITSLMRRHGFIAYPYEFWHYSSGDAFAELLLSSGKPGRYGPVHRDTATNTITVIENPSEPLNTDNEIAERIEQALKQLQEG